MDLTIATSDAAVNAQADLSFGVSASPRLKALKQTRFARTGDDDGGWREERKAKAKESAKARTEAAVRARPITSCKTRPEGPSLCIMRALNGQAVGKFVHYDPLDAQAPEHERRMKSASLPHAKWFEYEYIGFNDIHELHDIITAVAGDRSALFVFGTPEGQDFDGLVRILSTLGEESHSITDQGTWALAFDGDNIYCPRAEFRADPEGCVRRTLRRMGGAWAVTSCSWHASGSAGIGDYVKVRLFYKGSRKVSIDELRRITATANADHGRDFEPTAKVDGQPFDSSICTAYQKIFVSDPQMRDGIVEFMDCRHGKIIGEVDVLDVDALLARSGDLLSTKRGKPSKRRTDVQSDIDALEAELSETEASGEPAGVADARRMIDRAIEAGTIRMKRPGDNLIYPMMPFGRVLEGIHALMDIRAGGVGLPIPDGQRNLFAYNLANMAALWDIMHDHGLDGGGYEWFIGTYKDRFPGKDDAWWDAKTCSIRERRRRHYEGYVSERSNGEVTVVVQTPTMETLVNGWLKMTEHEQDLVWQLRDATARTRNRRRDNGAEARIDDEGKAKRLAAILRQKAAGATNAAIGVDLGLLKNSVDKIVSACRKQARLLLDGGAKVEDVAIRIGVTADVLAAAMPDVVAPRPSASSAPLAAGETVVQPIVCGSGGSNVAVLLRDPSLNADVEGEEESSTEQGVGLPTSEESDSSPVVSSAPTREETQAETAVEAPAKAPKEDFLGAWEGVDVPAGGSPIPADDDGSRWPSEGAREGFEVDLAGLHEGQRVELAEAAVSVILSGGSKAALLALYPTAPSLSAVLRQVAIRAREISLEDPVAAAVAVYGWVAYDLGREADWNARATRTAPSEQQVAYAKALSVETGLKLDTLALLDRRRCSREIERLEDARDRQRVRAATKAAKEADAVARRKARAARGRQAAPAP